ncbi:MAG TPA: isoprenylcysteine carboxylmethyltransferase family protein [Candidatus Eisenbacteria bacterium]|nr:isoprenylcysteine carboxylmethyltransferase family protein [Candidatus Eisenbacteria bacterium]
MIHHRIRSESTREPIDRRQEGLFFLLTLRPVGLAAMLGLFAFLIQPRWMVWSSVPLPGWLRWGGVVLAVLGGALIVWTLRTLGMNLTDTVVTRRAHTLVTSGPYRWVRHPFYLSALFMVVGNALAAANWFLFAAGTLTFILMAGRSRIEERKLLERFGGSYEEYRSRTGRFLPRIGGGR